MKISSKLALFAFAMLAVVPMVQASDEVANHHGHYDVTCYTKNGRGHSFRATGYSEHRRDYHLWRELQAEATQDCRASGAFICVEKGCNEVFHHEH